MPILAVSGVNARDKLGGIRSCFLSERQLGMGST